MPEVSDRSHRRPYRSNHAIDFLVAEIGMHRQRQHLAGQPFGDRQAPPVEVAERRVLVEREAIEQPGADPCLVEERPYPVAVRNADRVDGEGASEAVAWLASAVEAIS